MTTVTARELYERENPMGPDFDHLPLSVRSGWREEATLYNARPQRPEYRTHPCACQRCHCKCLMFHPGEVCGSCYTGQHEREN